MRHSLIPTDIFAHSAPVAGTRAVLDGFFTSGVQASTISYMADRITPPSSSTSRPR